MDILTVDKQSGLLGGKNRKKKTVDAAPKTTMLESSWWPEMFKMGITRICVQKYSQLAIHYFCPFSHSCSVLLPCKL